MGGTEMFVNITWLNKTIRFHSDNLEIIKSVKNLKNVLGKGNIKIGINNSISLDLVHIEQKKIEINKKENVVFIFGQSSEITSSILEVAIYMCFEYLFQMDGMFSLHASAVEVSGKAYLFCGPKEAGKTTISYSLSKEHNANIIANDHCIIGLNNHNKPYIFEGDANNFITFRSHALEKSDKQLYDKLFNKSESVNLRKRISVTDLGINFCNGFKEIDGIFFIGIGKTKHLEFSLLTKEQSSILLYDNISSIIRGISIMLFNNNKNIEGYIPDFSNNHIHQKAMYFLSQTNKNSHVYSLTGPKDEMVKKIIELVEV